jgi:putative colanic acid biosynthesis UDP-glucose lipid carrier transferase
MLPRGLLKEYSQILSFILRGFDIAAIVIAGLITYFFKFEDLDLNQHYVFALIIAAFLTLIVFSFFHIYESIRAKSFLGYLRLLIQALSTVFLFLAGLAFITKTGEEFSRTWFLGWIGTSFGFLILFRISLLLVLRMMRSQGWNERRIVIIGAGEFGEKLAKTVQQSLWTGFRIVAFLDDAAGTKPKFIEGIPVEQSPEDISAYLSAKKESIDEIWLALPLSAEARVKELMYALRHHTISIRFVLDIFGLDLLNHSVTDLAGFPTLNLNSSPMVGVNRVVKAIEDRVLAALILIGISPLLLFIALGVKLSSRGPVFFKQLRHGWDGHIIKIYKFRTMVEHQEDPGKITQATLNDQRITRFGKFLRKTSLDELPQFINVLQGKMSIVGPRPHAVSHNEYYKESIKAYMQRHKVKPGITGWAQVNGWRGETETLEKMQKRVEYDLYYIEHWSLLFDFKIILLTFLQGFVNKNAY